jgi:protein ImuB
LYLFLPSWAIDRLRRGGLLPNLGAAPGEAAPFATVIAVGGRQILAAVNPAAAAKGIAAGMPLADALSFLPGLLTRPAELAEDTAALRCLAEWCGRYSPWTAPDGADGIKIETTGSAHLWGGEAGLVADLSGRLARQGIAHRVAIADTLGAAWAVARFAASEAEEGACKLPVKTGKTGGIATSLVVSPGEIRAALAPLPIAALRLDPAIVEGLHRVGLRRIGEALAMPRDALARRFGDAVARRLDQALDDLPEPLSPLGEVPTRRVRLSLPEPIADPADLARAAERLTADLVARLEREGMGARRLDLGFHRVDGRVEHIRIGTARPSRDPAHLAKLLTGKLDTIDPGLGIQDVILAAFAVEPLAAEQIESSLPRTTSLHPNPPPHAGEGDGDHLRSKRAPSPSGGGPGWGSGPGLAPLFDRLGAKLGLDALAHLEPRASHIPERASVAVPISNSPHPNPPPLAGEGARLSDAVADSLPRRRGRAGVGVAPQKPPRPVRLFQPPEPVEAFWVLPDDPPFRFTWRHRAHRITQADGPERIAEEWWRPDGQLIDGAGSPDAIRDYYRVEDASGRRFWLFRAGLPGDPPPRWFLHGIFA